MAIGRLSGGLNPSRKMRDIVIVRDKRKSGGTCLLDSKQQRTSLSDCESVSRGLRKHANKPQFGNRASSESRKFLRAQPSGYAVVKFMMRESERNQSVDVQQVHHRRHILAHPPSHESREFCQNLGNLFACQYGRVATYMQNRQPRLRIGHDPGPQWTLLMRC